MRTAAPEATFNLNSDFNATIAVSRAVQKLCADSATTAFVRTTKGSALHNEGFFLVIPWPDPSPAGLRRARSTPPSAVPAGAGPS
ncbi:hypothetical protein [Streptomyces sp. NBC_00448]|uniref:hypothetical protein n=1 Tax=Streptomyces sp. NBC_00448 TaxID=2903652 RepID=UPI002E1F7DC8